MGIISWIVFGAVAGWLASLVAGTNKGQGWFLNIVIGIAGAIAGGIVWGFFDDNYSVDWSIGSFLVAIAGAAGLLFVWGLITKRS